MNSICCSPLLHRPDINASANLQVSASSRTRLNARASAEISLVTADGDTITLSAGSSLRTEHVAYDFLGRMRGQTVGAHSEKLQISTRSELAATVQGELDEEELADIAKLLDAIEKAAGDFFSGKSDGLLTSFAEIGNLDSIASFAAALSYSGEASLERVSSITSTAQAQACRQMETAAAEKPGELQSVKAFLDSLVDMAGRLEDMEDRLRNILRVIEEIRQELGLQRA